MLRVVLIVSLALASAVAGAETSAPEWEIAHQPLPGSMDGIDARGIGCLVVGARVLADGSVAQPIILQGAFNGHVDDAGQKRFSDAVLAAARSWRFRFIGKGQARSRYVTRSVGFRSGAGDRVVAGIEAQAEPLRQACQVPDIAAWGERAAIPVDKAVELHAGKVALRNLEGPPLWLQVGMEPPGYPSDGFTGGYSACVILGFVVASSGKASQFKIVSTRTWPLGPQSIRKVFEDASLVAAGAWTWSPSPANLSRLPEFRQVPVNFGIDGSPSPGCDPLDLEALASGAPPAPAPD